MSTRDIQDILQQLHGVEVSPTLILEVTAVVDEEVTAWHTRPLAQMSYQSKSDRFTSAPSLPQLRGSV